MKQSKLKACALFAGTAALLLGLGACNKEPSVPEEVMLVVPHAKVQAQVGERAPMTKASLDGTTESMTLNWEVGDKVVMVSNGSVNGTLTCKSVSGGTGSFEGDVYNFTPAGVSLFYLGNQSANGINASFDLSRQTGTMSGLVGMLFLKTSSDVVLEDVTPADAGEGEKVYALSGTVTFNPKPLLPILEVRNLDMALIKSGLVNADADEDGVVTDDEISAALLGVKTSSFKLEGLYNQVSINLTDDTVTGGYMPSTSIMTVGPVLSSERANSYFFAVVPQTATGVKMQINYVGADVSNVMLTGIDWTITADGSSFYSDMATKEGVEFGSMSFKYGYGAQTIGGGERADGMNQKNGYGGSTIDGANNTDASKGGYTGQEAY